MLPVKVFLKVLWYVVHGVWEVPLLPFPIVDPHSELADEALTRMDKGISVKAR